MGVIGTLQVNVAANIGKLTSGLAAGKSQVAGFARSAASEVNKFSESITTMQGAVVGVVGGGIASFVKSTIDTADALGDQADKLNINVEALQGLHYVAEQFSGTAAGMDKSLDFFNKTLGKTLAGSVELGAEFSRLHLSADELARMPLDKALLKTLDAISKLPLQSQQAAAMVELLGREAQDLAPTMRAGSAELEAMAKHLADIGGVASDESIKTLSDLKNSFNDLAAVANATRIEAVAAFGPVIQVAIDDTVDRLKAMQFVVKSLNDIFSKEGWKRFAQWSAGNPKAFAPTAPAVPPAKLTKSQEDWIAGHKALIGATRLPTPDFAPGAGMAGLASMFTDRSAVTERQFAKIDQFVNELDIGFGPNKAKNRIERYMPQGSAALEKGTAAAFSQERRSQQQNQVLEVSKKQLTEQQGMHKAMQNIDTNLRQSLLETRAANLS